MSLGGRVRALLWKSCFLKFEECFLGRECRCCASSSILPFAFEHRGQLLLKDLVCQSFRWRLEPVRTDCDEWTGLTAILSESHHSNNIGDDCRACRSVFQ